LIFREAETQAVLPMFCRCTAAEHIC